MSYNYNIRITVQGEESEYRSKVLNLITELGKGIGCFECPKDNPHYHFMIESTQKLACVRKKIQSLYAKGTYVKGDKRYSLQPVKGSENYICKGHTAYRIKPKLPHYDGRSDPVIIFNNMDYDEEDIRCFHEQFWEDQSNLYKVEKREKKEFIDLVDAWWNDGPSDEYGVRWMKSSKDIYEANRMAFSIAEDLMTRFKTLRRLSIYTSTAKTYVGYLMHTIVDSAIMVRLIHNRDNFFG